MDRQETIRRRKITEQQTTFANDDLAISGNVAAGFSGGGAPPPPPPVSPTSLDDLRRKDDPTVPTRAETTRIATEIAKEQRRQIECACYGVSSVGSLEDSVTIANETEDQDLVFTVNIFDPTAGVRTDLLTYWEFHAPKSGIYDCSCYLRFILKDTALANFGDAMFNLYVYKDGIFHAELDYTSGAQVLHDGSAVVSMNGRIVRSLFCGDYVHFRFRHHNGALASLNGSDVSGVLYRTDIHYAGCCVDDE